MGLPRGRRWVDLPRKPAPDASERWAEMKRLASAPAAELPSHDAIAQREQLHREADACTRRQGELRLTVTR